MNTKYNIAFFKNLFFLKVKFASSSLVATLADYSIYLLLVYRILPPVTSHIISASTGMLINFFLQKRYIFSLNRKISTAFMMSMMVSVVGISLGSILIYLFNKISFFADYQYITKLMVTGMIFFYNFYFKRFSFEKKFL